MSLTNLKLLNAFERHLKELTVITGREAYMNRFGRLYCLMMDGVTALSEVDSEEGGNWFSNVNYKAFSMSDLEWISDEFNTVPNAEDGESSIEDAWPEDVWRNKMLLEKRLTLRISMIVRLPSVRTMEEFF